VEDLHRRKMVRGFHSISFPSEWGLPRFSSVQSHDGLVSIQLVSPASGDSNINEAVGLNNHKFPFN